MLHARDATASTAATSPSRSCDRASASDRQAHAFRDERRLRPDGDRGSVSADRRIRARRGAGGENDDVTVRRLRHQEARRVERHEVGAERIDRSAARVLGRREEHPARRTRELGDQAVLRGDTRDERRLDAVLAEALGGSGTDGGDLRQVAPAPRDLVGAVRARDDDPVVPGGVDRVVGRPHDLDQRALEHLVAERLEPRDERPGLVARPRDDDLHLAPPSSGSRERPPGGTRGPLRERYRGPAHASVPALNRIS